MAGYIYVLKPNLTIGGASIVKIGMTTRSVAKRIRELSTGSPVALELIYSLHVENPKGVERHLHRRFAAHRISNGGGTEYFRIEARRSSPRSNASPPRRASSGHALPETLSYGNTRRRSGPDSWSD
jgi:hypothetical protein